MSSTKKAYKGPNPYNETDADIFCGRDNEIEIIIDNLLVKPLTILYGESGVGKSSILQAGVAHIFNKKDPKKLKKYGIPNKCAVTVFSLRQDDKSSLQDPLEGLKQQIKKDLQQIISNINLSEPQGSFVKTLQAWTEQLGGEEKDGELFIILDQFEDYFLLPQKNGKGSFIIEFASAINRAQLPVNFLISIREDAFAKLGCFRGWINNLFDNLIHLKYLNGNSATEAIVKPIEKYNENYNKTYQIGKDKTEREELVSAVLEQVKIGNIFQDKINIPISDDSQAEILENRFIETSYLQIVMEWLWDSAEKEDGKYILSLKKLEDFGEGDIENGIKKIVKEYLDKKIDQILDSDKENRGKQKEIIAYLFYHLITPGGTKLSITLNDFIKYCAESFKKVDNQEIEQLLTKLTNSRILRIDKEERYTICQDTLIPAINYWRNQYLQLVREITIKQWLLAQSLYQAQRGRYDLAGFLALKAYELIQQSNLDMLDQVYEALFRALSVERFGISLKGHWGGVTSVAFSPDGKLLASGSYDNKIGLWNLEPKNNDKPYFIDDAHLKVVSAVVFDPKKSKILVSGSNDGTVKLWDLENLDLEDQNLPKNKILCHYVHREKDREVPWKITSVAFSQDGLMLASGIENGTVMLFKSDASQSLSALCCVDTPNLSPIHKTKSETIYVNPDWKDACKPPLYILRKKSKEKGTKVCSLAFSPEGNLLAAGYSNGIIRLWDLNQNALMLDLDPHTPTKEINNYKRRQKHKKAVKTLAFNQDGNILASGSEDRTVWLCYLDKDDGNRYVRLGKENDMGEINSLAFSPKKNMLASGGEDQRVRLWNLDKTISEPKILPGQYSGISSVTFSPDEGDWLAAGIWNNTIKLWDLRPSKAEPKILKDDQGKDHSDNVMSVAYNSTRNILASASWDKTVRLWKIDQAADPPYQFYKLLSKEKNKRHSNRVWSVAFSPDGKFLASSGADDDRTVRLWDLDHLNKPIAVLEEAKDKDGVSSVAFSPDGTILAVGVWDDYNRGHDTVLLWKFCQIDQRKQKPLDDKMKFLSLRGKRGSITSVAFHPNENQKILAVAGNDGKIDLWNLDSLDWTKGIKNQNPKLEWSKKEHSARIFSVKFSPNGEILASGSDDRTIRLWKFDEKGEFQKKVIVLSGHDSWVGSVAFSEDSKTLASASYDGTIRLWDLNDELLDWEKGNYKSKPIILEGHEQSITSVVFIGNELLASGSYDKTVRLWTITSSEKLIQMVEDQVPRTKLSSDEWDELIGSEFPYPY